jgi:hypothetical protein
MMMMMMVVAARVAVGAVSSGLPNCRCLPGDACWPSPAQWVGLNASVGGRLHKSVDELSSCLGPAGTEKTSACWRQLNRTDDEFWIADQPNGYQHTGLWGSEHSRGPENEGKSWNTSVLSAYTVLAETETDFQQTVRFAAKHNLRLVVKATGHDWYGRSYAPGSLVLWTHKRKKISFHNAFVAVGSATAEGVPAVTVESGVQFSDIYPAAQATPYPNDPKGHKSIVMGGTCDSVGVGGCWLGGCCEHTHARTESPQLSSQASV